MNEASIVTLFPTRIYSAALADDELREELLAAAEVLSIEDEAGLAWCAKNGYPGYTSYASLDDLPWRFPAFKTLQKRIEPHMKAFVKSLEYNLGGGKLVMDSLWVNCLPEGGFHAAHIHPNSVISGTYYVAVPKGASAIRFEDPRHAMMMAAPPRQKKARSENLPFVSFQPEEGSVLLWESFLRHDVPVNQSEETRVSISFNYNWV